MSHSRSLPLIAGTDVSARPKSSRKRITNGQREARIIAAAGAIEALSPTYLELHRPWAKGSREGHGFVDANLPQEERRAARGPEKDALAATYAIRGADTAP